MAAVRGLRISVKATEPEPMEVEEGELLLQAAAPATTSPQIATASAEELAVPVGCSLRELLPVTEPGKRAGWRGSREALRHINLDPEA